MTKFQFHVLLALGFLILSQSFNGVSMYILKFFVLVFVVFALVDIYKLEQKKYFNKKY